MPKTPATTILTFPSRRFVFRLMLEGFGSDPQDVFGEILERLQDDPHSVIVGEVEYDESDVDFARCVEPAEA